MLLLKPKSVPISHSWKTSRIDFKL